MVFDNFKDSRSLAFPGLGFRVLAAKVGDTQRSCDLILHRVWECHQVFLTGPDPK